MALFIVVSSTTGRRRLPGRAGQAAPRREADAPKARRRSARTPQTYTVKPGDTPSGIAEKVERPAGPDPGAQPRPRPADARRRARRSSCGDAARAEARAAAAALALALAPAARAAAAAPPPISAPAAIVVEAAPARSLYARAAEKRRAIASTTKLMTALLTMERAKLVDIVRAVDYRRAPIESKLSLQPGERMIGRRPAARLLLESANDAAVTLAEHVSGSRGVRAADEPRARELGLRGHPLRQPDRARRAGQLLLRRDLARLAGSLLRKHSFIRKIADRVGDAPDRLPRRARSATATRSCAGPVVNGVKTGHTQQAGYVLVGSAPQARGHARLGRARDAERGGARRDSLALLRWGGPLPRVAPVPRGRWSRAPEIQYRAAPTVALVTGGTAPALVRRGAKIVRMRRGRAGRGRRGPIRAGRSSATARCSPTASGSSRACRSSPRPSCPRRTVRSAPRTASRARGAARSRRSCWAVRSCWRAACAAAARRRPPLGSRRPHDPHRHAQHGDRQDARGARTSASAGATARSSRPTMPGGKGVNVARVLKTLGQPVIATGLAGGATGTRHRRAAHRALGALRLRPHPRGVAHEHRGDRPDDRRADRDQRARPAGLRAGDRAVRRQAPLPRPRALDVRVRGLAPARRRDRRLRAADPRAKRARRRRRSSTPTATRCAARSAPSPT